MTSRWASARALERAMDHLAAAIFERGAAVRISVSPEASSSPTCRGPSRSSRTSSRTRSSTGTPSGPRSWCRRARRCGLARRLTDNGPGVPDDRARADLRALHSGASRGLRRDGPGPVDLQAHRRAARRHHRRRARSGWRQPLLVPAAGRRLDVAEAAGCRAGERAGGAVPASAMVLAAASSVQFGAALAATLFDDLGPAGTSRCVQPGCADPARAIWRPRVRGVRPATSAWRPRSACRSA